MCSGDPAFASVGPEEKAMGMFSTSAGPLVPAGAQNTMPQSTAFESAAYLDWRLEGFRSKALLIFYHSPTSDPLCSLKQVMELELLSLPANHEPS